ncbi:heat shock factor [Rhizoctonia solani]|uniref:Heat shock factor n=1 Tax=Rhizoctonia solani TaxID=456999 RepID=A0A8H7I7V6_9AGAM|nr:heat shock factor [Rhizoctonia solani]
MTFSGNHSEALKNRPLFPWVRMGMLSGRQPKGRVKPNIKWLAGKRVDLEMSLSTTSTGPVLPPPLATLPLTLPPTTPTTHNLPVLHGNMASSTDQLALTKTNRAQAVSTSTRQAVPAFLNKLYNMVSNPETDELVRWSEEGDSFYIPSHERLSKELLPRFFKHGNFSSFVRQLNMYGFHKVPHLQQGVLQNSTETELWQFQNPHFQRGQPDLLCLITRKKTGGNAEGSVNVEDIQHSNHAIGPTTSANQSSGPLDMTVLTSSLSAIKKHQTSLSAELKSLQESNQHLWNEALAARDRHKKHQDTINKILKFLASVFGNGANGATPSGPGGNSSPGRDGRASPGALVPRKRPRLMIENGSADDDDDDDIHFAIPSPNISMQDDHEMLEGRISEAPTEMAPSPAPNGEQLATVAKAEPPPTPGLSSLPPTPIGIPTTNITPPQDSVSSDQPSDTPESLFGQGNEHAQDQMYQEAISKLLSSPNTLQRILASISSQGPDGHNSAGFSDSQSELAPYYGGLMNMNLDVPHDPAIPYNAARLDQATESLGEEIDNVNQDINSLMREWGISPEVLQEQRSDGSANNVIGVDGFSTQPNLTVNGFVPSNSAFMPNGSFPNPNGNILPDSSVPYASIAAEGDHAVDIDSFLNQFDFPDSANAPSDGGPSTGGSFPVSLPAEFDLENPGAQPAAFLDEVPPVPSTASDTSLSPVIPLLDDFGGASGVGVNGVGLGGRQTSPARFTTAATNGIAPVTSVNHVPVAPAIATATATAATPSKRGRKRRSVTLEGSIDEPTLTPTTRSTRNNK